MAGSLMTVAREMSGYKLNLVGVQEVRWEGGGIAVSINIIGRIQMGKPTIRLTTFY
jgi:hypothetical protein